MFSSRTPASLEPNRLTLAIAERRRAGLPIYDLTLSNPTQSDLPYRTEEILAALADPRSLTYEPTPQGLLEAREAIAEFHRGFGHPADPSRLVLTASTSEAYSWVFRLLCEPGDEVLAPKPSYPLFDCLAELDAVELKAYALDGDDGWQPDFRSLEAARTARTRAVIAVNPNNPTGTYLRADSFLRLQEWCGRHELALISDEVFHPYAWDPALQPASSLDGPHAALTFTLNGLSKLAGLPQMKLGWIHVDGPAERRAEAMARLEWIADAYLPVSAPVQHAAARWLAESERVRNAILGRVRTNVAELQHEFPPVSGCRVLEAQAGWSATLEVPRILSDEEWALALLNGPGVLVQPGFLFDFERDGRLILSLLLSTQDYRSAVRKMKTLIQLRATGSPA